MPRGARWAVTTMISTPRPMRSLLYDPLSDPKRQSRGDTPLVETERSLTSSEKHSREGHSSERPSPPLPAVRHAAFARHWLAVDDGGAELTKAAFGAPARRAPQRFATLETSSPRPSVNIPQGTSTPSRLRSTVILLLFALAVLFAEPAARLVGRAFGPRSETPGTAEVSGGKAGALKPSPRPVSKRAGEA